MNGKPWSAYIGFDPREAAAYAVARQSAGRLSNPIPIKGVVLSDLQKRGLYTRPTEIRMGKLWDVISGAHMSTEFAISRFFVPLLAGSGWAVFMDCDVIVKESLCHLFNQLDDRYAVYCVKHNYKPSGSLKMDGHEQYVYPRKNWSSVMVFNCDHPSNKKLTLDVLNSWPGRKLHGFEWLRDEEIGELHPSWNWLVGEQPEPEGGAKIVHMTLGGPWINSPPFQNVPYAAEWRDYLERWAA